MRDFHDRALGVAVEQQIGFGVDQHRTADLVLPVVVVGDAAQRCLDSAEHDRHIAKRLATALRVHQRAAIRAQAAFIVGRVGVVAADFSVRRVAVDHRIHIAGGDAEKEIRFAQCCKCIAGLPVRLRDNSDAKALRLEQAADNRHAKTRVIDVGIAGDDDDVAAVPAQLIHLGARHRQKGRRSETLGPIAAIIEQFDRRSGGAGYWHGADRVRGLGLRAGFRWLGVAAYSTSISGSDPPARRLRPRQYQTRLAKRNWQTPLRRALT